MTAPPALLCAHSHHPHHPRRPRVRLIWAVTRCAVALLLACAGAQRQEAGAAAAPAAPAPSAIDADQANAGSNDELAQLMALLGQRRSARADFQETQYLAVLTQPLVSSGSLLYQAPDHLEQHVVLPRRQDMIIDHGMLTMQIGPHRRTVPLADYPQLEPLLESMRATLAGDRAALERLFQLRLSGPLDHWQLTLQPRDAELAKRVQSIQVQGARAQIREVQVLETDGDHSVMQIQSSE